LAAAVVVKLTQTTTLRNSCCDEIFLESELNSKMADAYGKREAMPTSPVFPMDLGLKIKLDLTGHLPKLRIVTQTVKLNSSGFFCELIYIFVL
jgi:hypothetical protein